MKVFRKMLKLLPPAFLMRVWLDRRYGIKVRPAPGGAVARFILALLPYAFTAALSVRVDSDCRLLKYYLPYWKMKNFVRLAYGMQRGNDALDHGVIGAFRAIMPYGLVLWWDAEDMRIGANGGKSAKQVMEAAPCGIPVVNPGNSISDDEHQELQRMDRIEAMALRLLIMAAERES